MLSALAIANAQDTGGRSPDSSNNREVSESPDHHASACVHQHPHAAMSASVSTTATVRSKRPSNCRS
jgi:hypothetical protein